MKQAYQVGQRFISKDQMVVAGWHIEAGHSAILISVGFALKNETRFNGRGEARTPINFGDVVYHIGYIHHPSNQDDRIIIGETTIKGVEHCLESEIADYFRPAPTEEMVHSIRYMDAKYALNYTEHGKPQATILEIQRCEWPNESPIWEIWEVGKFDNGAKFEICHTESGDAFEHLPTEQEILDQVSQNYDSDGILNMTIAKVDVMPHNSTQ